MRATSITFAIDRAVFDSEYAYTIYQRDTKYIASVPPGGDYCYVEKVNDTLYKQDNRNYFITEEHPFFNAAVLIRNSAKWENDNELISYHRDGVRYLVKKSIEDVDTAK